VSVLYKQVNCTNFRIRTAVMMVLHQFHHTTQHDGNPCKCESKRHRIRFVQDLQDSIKTHSARAVYKLCAIIGVAIFCTIEEAFGSCPCERFKSKMIIRSLYGRAKLDAVEDVELYMGTHVAAEDSRATIICHRDDPTNDSGDLWSLGMDFAVLAARYQERLHGILIDPRCNGMLLLVLTIRYLAIQGATTEDRSLTILIKRITDIYEWSEISDAATLLALEIAYKNTSRTALDFRVDQMPSQKRARNAAMLALYNPSRCILHVLLKDDFRFSKETLLSLITTEDKRAIIPSMEERLNMIERTLEKQLQFTPSLLRMNKATCDTWRTSSQLFQYLRVDPETSTLVTKPNLDAGTARTILSDFTARFLATLWRTKCCVSLPLPK
jgi:hypothetical protein